MARQLGNYTHTPGARGIILGGGSGLGTLTLSCIMLIGFNTAIKILLSLRDCGLGVINRPGVDRTVLQTPLLLIHQISHLVSFLYFQPVSVFYFKNIFMYI